MTRAYEPPRPAGSPPGDDPATWARRAAVLAAWGTGTLQTVAWPAARGLGSLPRTWATLEELAAARRGRRLRRLAAAVLRAARQLTPGRRPPHWLLDACAGTLAAWRARPAVRRRGAWAPPTITYFPAIPYDPQGDERGRQSEFDLAFGVPRRRLRGYARQRLEADAARYREAGWRPPLDRRPRDLHPAAVVVAFQTTRHDTLTAFAVTCRPQPHSASDLRTHVRAILAEWSATLPLPLRRLR